MSDATRREFLATVAGSAVAGAGPGRVGSASAGEAPAGEPTPAARAPTASTASPSFAGAAEFESFVDGVMRERVGELTPGMTVSVVEGDDVVLAKGYGHADVETRRPVRADETAFPVGSVSKAVTFTGVVQAVEEGLLDLHADVTTYLEDSAVEVPDTYDEPVTLAHLGTHTAGFESQVPRFLEDPADLTSLEEALVETRPDRVRPPGETVEYSNYGAALAGHVLERVRDAPFDEVVRSELFDPLGMDHSTFAQPVPADRPGTLARPHDREEGSFVPTDEGYVEARPAGSMTATATDMAAFMRAHLGSAVGGERVLDPGTVGTMHDRHYVRHPAVNNWRYGFYEAGPVDAGLIAHSGGTPNAASEVLLVPERELGLFVAYNTAPSENVLLADLLRILREYGLVPDPGPPTPTIDPDRARRAETVAGEYSPTFLYDDGPARVLERLGRLSVTATGDGRLRTGSLSSRFGDGLEWVEVDPYVYREVGGSDVLAFDVADGDVEKAHVSSLPQSAYEPVAPTDRRALTAGIVGGSLAGFGLSLAGRGARGAWRRLKARRVSSAGDGAPSDRDAAGREGSA